MTSVLDDLRTVKGAVATLAVALTGGMPDEVLAAEAPLAAAVNRLEGRCLGPTSPAEAEEIRRLVLDIRFTMTRCQALGTLSAELLRVFTPSGYGRTGGRARTAPPVILPTLDSRM